MTRRFATLFAGTILIAVSSVSVSAQSRATIEKFRAMVEEDGSAVGQMTLGLMYESADEITEAVRWYRLAADQGHADAQARLAVMYATGRDVPQNDVEAARWYQLLEDQGDALTQFNLAVMYVTGRGFGSGYAGVPRDDAEAVRWYRLAADQGHAEAQYNLGVMYSTGSGVPRDDAEAVLWWQAAADQGNAGGQFYLGMAYADGTVVPQNDVTAHMWLNLASSRLEGALGHRAQEARDQVAEELNPIQRAEAQRLAREWDEANPRD